MGNCQAVDAAALVIQHPSGKQERMYCSITASQVMKTNPGHYVSLIIPLQTSEKENSDNNGSSDNSKTVKYTRVKLLRPTDSLVLGRAYRLVTTQEVMKVLKAKKHAKTKRNIPQSSDNVQINSETRKSAIQKNNKSSRIVKIQKTKRDTRNMQRSGSTKLAKTWRPSLQSISESPSRDHKFITKP